HSAAAAAWADAGAGGRGQARAGVAEAPLTPETHQHPLPHPQRLRARAVGCSRAAHEGPEASSGPGAPAVAAPATSCAGIADSLSATDATSDAFAIYSLAPCGSSAAENKEHKRRCLLRQLRRAAQWTGSLAGPRRPAPPAPRRRAAPGPPHGTAAGGQACAAAAGLGFGAQLAALLAQLPLELHEVLQFTVPTRQRPQGLSYSQCRRYEGDMAAAYLKWITTRNRPHQGNSSQPTIPCDQGWHYNFTGGFSTISTDLNWVCSDGWKPYVVHFTFCISAIVGIYLWSFLAQRWGRLWALLGALGAGLAGAVATLPPAAHLGA
ncbi:Solute carrier family 22 member 1, partial [Gryllus bimaculatus]